MYNLQRVRKEQSRPDREATWTELVTVYSQIDAKTLETIREWILYSTLDDSQGL